MGIDTREDHALERSSRSTVCVGGVWGATSFGFRTAWSRDLGDGDPVRSGA